MSDVTSQDFNRLAEAIESMVGSQAKFMKGSGGRNGGTKDDDAADKDRKKKTLELNANLKLMAGHLGTVDKGFANLYKETTDVSKAMKQTASGFTSLAAGLTAITTITGLVANSLSGSITQFRELSNVGQTFSGSMLKMHIAAANAALPLEEFGELIKKNNQVVGAIGVKAFTDMGKGLRNNLKQFGMLGMTTDQLNEYLGSYMETQRMYGNLQNINSDRATDSMQDLAIQTTRVAELTGKNRMEILKQSQQAMRDNSMISRMMLSAGQNTEAMSKAAQKAMVYMSGMPGKAGETLSMMLAQTVGRGSAELTDQMQGFIDGGMYGVTSLMNSLAAKVKSGKIEDGDMEQFRDKFVKEGKANMSAIKYQADMGNENAARIVEMIAEMENLSKKQLNDLGQQHKTTQFMMNLQENFKQLSGVLKSKLFISLEQVWKGFDNFGKSEAFNQISEKFGVVGKKIGDMISAFISDPEKMKSLGFALAGTLDLVATGLVEFGKMIVWTYDTLGPTFTKLGEIMSTALTYLSPVFNFLASAISTAVDGIKLMVDNFGVLGTAITVASVMLAKAFVASKIKDKMGEKFNIGNDTMRRAFDHKNRAMRVWVVNGGGTGGYDGDGPDRKKKRRKRRRGKLPNSTPSGNKSSSIWERTKKAGRAVKTGAQTVAEAPGRVATAAKNTASATVQGTKKVTTATVQGAKTAASATKKAGSAVVRGAGSGLKMAGKGVKMASMGARALGPGLLALGAEYAVDKYMPDDMAGKSTAKAGLGIAGMAATGAMIGSAVPGIGTLAGGIVGGIVGAAIELNDNWDGLTKDANAAISAASGLMDSSLGVAKTAWNASASALQTGFTATKDGIVSTYDSISQSFSNVIDSTFSYIKDIDWAGMGNSLTAGFVSAKDSIMNVTSMIGTGFSDMFSWAAKTLTPSDSSSPIISALSMFPIGGAAMMAINSLTGKSPSKSQTTVSGPAQQKPAETAKVNTEQLEQQLKAMQTQQREIMKENAELRRNMSKLMDVLVQGNSTMKAGMIEQIEAIRKGNKSLRNIANSQD